MNLKNISSQPIGVFDSGIGGLTVAHALVQQLPKENLIYFGDTAHMPYGDKSTAAIQAYAVKIAHMLIEKECKLILIACNSASAAAYELVKEYIGSKAVVMNVIDPTISLLREKYTDKRIGLIGTRQTVNSNIYQKKMDACNSSIQLASYPTNLLAQAIEEFGNHAIIDTLLDVYLTRPQLQDIQALILACTHYPVIKDRIAQFYNHTVEIIDSSEIVATAVKSQLEKHGLLNENKGSIKQFYVSDYTDSFAYNAKLFFGNEITLLHYPLWD